MLDESLSDNSMPLLRKVFIAPPKKTLYGCIERGRSGSALPTESGNVAQEVHEAAFTVWVGPDAVTSCGQLHLTPLRC